jgi:hypothetical protein
MEEASKTIAGEGEPVDIKQLNEELSKTDLEIEELKASLRLPDKELALIEADAEDALKEVQKASAETVRERDSETKIDEFAAEVAKKNAR